MPWIAEPYLVEGEIHLLVGDGWTGKSLLALDTALGLAAGQRVLVDCEVPRRYRVLYVDEDGSAAQAARRVLGLAKGRNFTFESEMADHFTIYSGEGFLLDNGERAKRFLSALERHKPEVLVLDALRAFHGGNENDSRDMALVLRQRLRPLAKQYGLTVVVLHHTSKESSDSATFRTGPRSAAQASRGSTEIRNGVDTVLYVERRNGVPTLFVDKARNLEDSEKPDPLAFSARKDNDGTLRIIRVGSIEPIPRPKLALAKQELEAALSQGEELAHGDLMSRLPGLKGGAYSKRTAREALAQMVPGVFVQRQDGKNVFYRRAEAA